MEKSDDTKILTEKSHKLPNDITLKNLVIFIIWVVKDGAKFYPQIFLEVALVA